MIIVELSIYFLMILGIVSGVMAFFSIKIIRVNYRTPTGRAITKEDVEIVRICSRNAIKRQVANMFYCFFWLGLSTGFFKVALVLIQILPDKVPTVPH